MSKVRIKPLSIAEDYLNATGGRTKSTQQIHFDKHPTTDRSSRFQSTAEMEELGMLRERVKQLERTVTLQQKEINRLQQMNEFLITCNQQKLDLINQERKGLFKRQPSPQEQRKSLTRLPNVEKTRTKMFKIFKEKMETSRARGSIVLKKEGSSPLKTNILRKSTLRNSQLINDDETMNLRSDVNIKEKRENNQFFSFLQVEECFKINAILNINLKDSEAVNLYENDGAIMLIDKLLEEEETFQDLIVHANAQKISFLYDKLNRILHEHKQMFSLILRLKKIIRGAIQMSSSVLLDDALTTIVDEIVACLECDRASCFVVDHSKNELWSKVAKGTQQVIRFPIGKGIAGHVAASKELLNIQNAYLDTRFNQEFDQRTNYKTRTLLVCPIMDRDKCLGVLQCVNKFDGHFTKDDEALLLILAEFSKVVLNNAINHDEQLLIHNKLRHSIKTGLIMTENVYDLNQLMITSQLRLKAMMNVDFGKVALLSQDKSQVIHCLEDGSMMGHPKSLGIMGECLTTGRMINIFNCYSHTQFNPLVDLETQMPVIILPIKSPLKENEIIGAIEVVNVKGFATMFQKIQPKITTIDQEVLEFFTQQVAQSVIINQQLSKLHKSTSATPRYSVIQIADDMPSPKESSYKTSIKHIGSFDEVDAQR